MMPGSRPLHLDLQQSLCHGLLGGFASGMRDRLRRPHVPRSWRPYRQAHAHTIYLDIVLPWRERALLGKLFAPSKAASHLLGPGDQSGP
jgi:hypothetical protein